MVTCLLLQDTKFLLEYGYGQDSEPGVIEDVKYKTDIINKKIERGALNLRNLYKKHVKRTIVIIFEQKELTVFVEYLKKAKLIIALYSIKEKKNVKKTQLHRQSKKKS